MKKKKLTKREWRIMVAMHLIEEVIEPLHYPKRGVEGEKYYELEDKIIEVLNRLGV